MHTILFTKLDMDLMSVETHPVLTSICVFVVGWILDRGYKFWDRNHKRKSIRFCVLEWINIIQPKELQLAASLRELSAKIGSSDDLSPLPYSMPITTPERINEISVELLIDSFVDRCNLNRSKKSKHVYSIISQIYYLAEVKKEIKDKYIDYQERIFDIIKQFNYQCRLLNESPQITDTRGKYYALFKEWEQRLEYSPNSLMSHKLFIKHLIGKLSKDDSDLLSIAIHFNDLLTEREAYNVGYSRIFKDLAENIETSINELVRNKEFFSNSPRLNWG